MSVVIVLMMNPVTVSHVTSPLVVRGAQDQSDQSNEEEHNDTAAVKTTGENRRRISEEEKERDL